MNVLLINPPRVIEEGNVWKDIYSCMPPIGLGILASCPGEEEIMLRDLVSGRILKAVY